MYDWVEEKRELCDKTVEDQRAILAKGVKDIAGKWVAPAAKRRSF